MTNSATVTSVREELPVSLRPTACLLCGEKQASSFFRLDHVPVLCNTPCETRAAALQFPTGTIQLAFCSNCGHVFNRAFVPEAAVYGAEYENSLHFSAHFQRYIDWLAADLLTRHNLYEKDIIEIGCGKGDFLALLCRLGNNRGTGFDPSYEPERLQDRGVERVHILRENYSESFGHLKCDLLCCRQTLEHIPDPAAFLRSVRRALGQRHATAVLFEVPNALYTLRHKGIWDIIYEHVSYFWATPLEGLFAANGFRVLSTRETYDGQFLCIEASPWEDHQLATDPQSLAQVTGEVRAFADTFRSCVDMASRVLTDLQRNKGRAVIWGTGSKGVMFLNLFRNYECLQHAVDINPHKSGKFVPGSGHSIADPEFLREYQPDVIFVMNPIYSAEIAQRIAAMELKAETITV